MDDTLPSDFFVRIDDLLNNADRSHFIVAFNLLQVVLKSAILTYFSYYIKIIFGLNSVFYLYNMRSVLKHLEGVYL